MGDRSRLFIRDGARILGSVHARDALGARGRALTALALALALPFPELATSDSASHAAESLCRRRSVTEPECAPRGDVPSVARPKDKARDAARLRLTTMSEKPAVRALTEACQGFRGSARLPGGLTTPPLIPGPAIRGDSGAAQTHSPAPGGPALRVSYVR